MIATATKPVLNGETWRFADGTPNAHSRRTAVVTAERLIAQLAELLEYERGQEVMITVWEKEGVPRTFWLPRCEARKLSVARLARPVAGAGTRGEGEEDGRTNKD